MTFVSNTVKSETSCRKHLIAYLFMDQCQHIACHNTSLKIQRKELCAIKITSHGQSRLSAFSANDNSLLLQSFVWTNLMMHVVERCGVLFCYLQANIFKSSLNVSPQFTTSNKHIIWTLLYLCLKIKCDSAVHKMASI